jgi:predicted amidohydrolase
MARGLDRCVDVLLLPGLWTGLNAGDSERFLSALRGLCDELGVYSVAGSMMWRVDGDLVDRSWIINDAGEVAAFYDRAHVFSGGDGEPFKAGGGPLLFDIGGVPSSVVIGYDLWFPEYTCSIGRTGTSVIFVPARCSGEWGEWGVLVRSLAATCQTYVVACCAPGSLSPGGRSMIVSPSGDLLASLEGEGTLIVDLDLTEPRRRRGRFPLERDRRPELYKFLYY